MSGAGKGLNGRGNDLREVFQRFEPLHRDLARVTTAIARRRTNLQRLIHNYGSLVTELGQSDDDVARLVQQSRAVFEAFAAEDQNISEFVASCPAPCARRARRSGRSRRSESACRPRSTRCARRSASST